MSIPDAALATQLLPVCLCNRLSWSVIIAVICAAALLIVVDRLAVVLLLLLMVLLMLLAGGLLEAGSRGIAGLSRKTPRRNTPRACSPGSVRRASADAEGLAQDVWVRRRSPMPS